MIFGGERGRRRRRHRAGHRGYRHGWLVLPLYLTLGVAGPAPVAQEREPSPAAPDGIGLGERMYREGVRPNGEPMRAIVAGDVEVDGRMFTCVNCHRRSGIGSLEGPVIALPVNGKELAAPRRRAGAWNPSKQRQGPGSPERWSLPPRFQMEDLRPPYTDETLARVLRTGVDPTGRVLNRAMPRYDLDDSDMALLIRYLKNLSTETDPGADEQTIRFATVVTEGVSEADRDAMLAVLRAHIDARNTQTRPYERRAKAGPFYKTEKYGAYRKLTLDVWELTGSPDTWRDQLEARYRAKPVFALLGGIAAGPWAPIHAFCEEHEIPAIFPVTDQPVVSDSDWYTLYFSKGLYQEGEAAARFLRKSGRLGTGGQVLQVFRPGTKGADAARGFRETWERNGGTGLVSRPLADGDDLSAAIRLPAGEERPSGLLLWLDGADLVSALKGPLAQRAGSKAVVASWSLTREDLGRVPESARNLLYLTYPNSLPDVMGKRLRVLNGWLRARKIPPGDPKIQSEMYFLGWMLPGALSEMRSEFYRDYFMEAFEMMVDQDYAIAAYPRLSFGPDQRYASKGCYVVQLSSGENPQVQPVSDWVIY
jgi:hypothetical protein